MTLPLTADDWQAIRLTLLIATTAVAATLPLAVAVAWQLAKRDFPGKFLVETLVNLPLVLPPVVTGYFLLVLFGREGWLGAPLQRLFGWRFVFDWKGAALAAAVVAFPLIVRPIRLGFEAIDDRLVQAARTLGAGRFDAFWSISLPLARGSVLSGALLGFARSMGEFGATIMIAGSIPGETRTMSLMIYSLLETPGGMRVSLPLVWTSIAIAAGSLLIGEAVNRRGRRRLSGAAA